MENVDHKLNDVCAALMDALGTAAMHAGTIQDERIKSKVYELLEEEAIRLTLIRQQLFHLKSE